MSWSGYQVNWENTYLDFFHNTIWDAERAMDSWVNGRTQSDNKVYNCFANTGSWFSETATDFDIQNSLISTTSPFEDASNQNFMPKAGSAVIDQAQVISGFIKPYKGGAPDIGPYERGGTQWTAGIGAIEDTGEPLNVNDFDNLEGGYKLYPNPAHDEVYIAFTNGVSSQVISVEIYSLLGRKVTSSNFNDSKQQISISVKELAIGTYILKMVSENNVTTRKFVRN